MLLFIVDVTTGVLPLDVRVAQLLREQDRPVLLVANKCDNAQRDTQAGEFNSLGFGEPMCASAKQKRGRNRLIAAIDDALGHMAEPVDEPAMKLAIVGWENIELEGGAPLPFDDRNLDRLIKWGPLGLKIELTWAAISLTGAGSLPGE